VAPITDKSKVGKVLASAFAVRRLLVELVWRSDDWPVRAPVRLQAVLLVYFVLCVSATLRFKPDAINVRGVWSVAMLG
jgi:hypothetical protein